MDRNQVLEFLQSEKVANCESLYEIYELFEEFRPNTTANALTQVLITDGGLTPQEILDGIVDGIVYDNGDKLLFYKLFNEVKYPTKCTLKIPPNFRVIPSTCFYECDWLVSVSGEQVEHIEPWAFSKCENLKSVNFPNVREAGSGAFSDCRKLLKMNLQSLKDIDTFTFSDCVSLTSLVLPNLTGEALEPLSFDYCSNLVLSLSKNTIGYWDRNKDKLNHLKSKVADVKFI